MPFLSNCTYPRFSHFFSHQVLIQSTQFFSGTIHIYKVLVFHEAFSLLATIAMIPGKVFFFLFPWQTLLGIQILSSKSCCLSNQTIISLKNCCEGVSYTPLLRTQKLDIGVKCSRFNFFRFLQPLVI